jgi:hypothetical protein
MKADGVVEKKRPPGRAGRGETGVSGERRRRMGGEKSAAKVGMTLSMGALIVTGLMRGRGARTLHIWSGVALVGFSLWHHSLYRPQGRKNKA